MKSTGHNPGRTRFVVAERGFVVPKQTEQAGVIDLPVGGVEKAARNQVVFREVNERIAELTGLFNETGVNLFICECSDPACAAWTSTRTARTPVKQRVSGSRAHRPRRRVDARWTPRLVSVASTDDERS
jgi:hypothetical protein